MHRPPNVGVLALQGAFAAHRRRLADLGAVAVEVRRTDHLVDIDGLVMPGGESTTMSNLLTSSGLFDEIKARVGDGLPVLGTCAGMILLARDVLDGRPDQRCFGAVDITLRRNGYGRQLQSFETDLRCHGIGEDGRTFHGLFIRAPRVDDAGPEVEVLASHDGSPVLVRQGDVIAAAFHPELTDDDRIHRAFLDRVAHHRKDG